MINLNGIELKELMTVRNRIEKENFNESLNGTMHGYYFGYHYEIDIQLDLIDEPTLQKLYALKRNKFLFIDNDGFKAQVRIKGDINAQPQNIQGDKYYKIALKLIEVKS